MQAPWAAAWVVEWAAWTTKIGCGRAFSVIGPSTYRRVRLRGRFPSTASPSLDLSLVLSWANFAGRWPAGSPGSGHSSVGESGRTRRQKLASSPEVEAGLFCGNGNPHFMRLESHPYSSSATEARSEPVANQSSTHRTERNSLFEADDRPKIALHASMLTLTDDACVESTSVEDHKYPVIPRSR